MHRALERLPLPCDFALTDCMRLDVPIPHKSLIHGDALSFSIAAASILAKVGRDNALDAWDRVFPGYGLAHNKGYSTPDHTDALRRLGPTPLHRFSFEPVRLASPLPPTAPSLGRGTPESTDQIELFACP